MRRRPITRAGRRRRPLVRLHLPLLGGDGGVELAELRQNVAGDARRERQQHGVEGEREKERPAVRAQEGNYVALVCTCTQTCMFRARAQVSNVRRLHPRPHQHLTSSSASQPPCSASTLQKKKFEFRAAPVDEPEKIIFFVLHAAYLFREAVQAALGRAEPIDTRVGTLPC